MSTSIELFEIQRWMKDAACKGNTEANWFPETPARNPAVVLAISICNQCAVKQECLDYAMARPDLQGVWGGLSARKRGSLRAKGYNND
jgi:WhiB family redox-sensing transcriptional regulator